MNDCQACKERARRISLMKFIWKRCPRRFKKYALQGIVTYLLNEVIPLKEIAEIMPRKG